MLEGLETKEGAAAAQFFQPKREELKALQAAPIDTKKRDCATWR
jgi:hypothetical protein